MSEIAYAILDSSGNMINHLISDKPPILHDPSHSYVINTVNAGIGWICKNGILTDPIERSIQYTQPPPIQEQIDIATLKADVQTLTASLTQVINTLNNLTRPTSATKK